MLGLGDRHPSNLMLDRFRYLYKAIVEVAIHIVNLFFVVLNSNQMISCFSGKILHIDFGDCFEASMNREKFPEKVSWLCFGLYFFQIT